MIIIDVDDKCCWRNYVFNLADFALTTLCCIPPRFVLVRVLVVVLCRAAQTKFRLALACGNIEVAMHTADKLPDDAIWHQLGTEALRQGNHQVKGPRR